MPKKINYFDVDYTHNFQHLKKFKVKVMMSLELLHEKMEIHAKIQVKPSQTTKSFTISKPKTNFTSNCLLHNHVIKSNDF